MRILQHPILKFKRFGKIKFILNGNEYEGYENETIASALLANGIKIFSKSCKYSRPRGFFCAIGKCSSCVMRVNGVPNVKTCVTLLKPGMVIERQENRGSLPETISAKSSRSNIECDVLVIGSGPAGMFAAKKLSKYECKVVVLDENPVVGGQLIKQTHKFFGSRDEWAGYRGIDIAKLLYNDLVENHVKFMLNTSAIMIYNNKVISVKNDTELIEINAKKIIIATGAQENFLTFENCDLPGVIGAGGAQTIMNVYGIKPGNNVLMVGSGNVGLIVSYQMLQAGINVKYVVEAMPKIGGYYVHAAKLRRYNVQILTEHTVKKAYGTNEVTGAQIVKLKNFKEVEGSEFDIDVDLICIAVGLTPSVELTKLANCKHTYIQELGGFVPVHNRFMATSNPNVWTAGDCCGIGEATTAMIEGKISALVVAKELGKKISHSEINENIKRLEIHRSGSFGLKTLDGKNKLYILSET